jgi:heme-degrading monooxygenase HmoA
MIERHWKGVAKVEAAQNYERHLMTDTFVKLGSMNGFIKATIMKRYVTEGVEYLIVTVWKSREAIHAFVGEVIDIAVVPKAAADMMVSFDKKVYHYEVVEEYAPL